MEVQGLGLRGLIRVEGFRGLGVALFRGRNFMFRVQESNIGVVCLSALLLGIARYVMERRGGHLRPDPRKHIAAQNSSKNTLGLRV